MSDGRKILLWLDDVRYPPTNEWMWVKTAEDAINVLKTKQVIFASLDHDLAPEHYPWHPNYDRVRAMRTSGVAVTHWLAREAWHGNEEFLPTDGIRVHSMNTVGSYDMIQDIQSAYDIRHDTNGLAFQCDTKYGILPWQLYGQPNGWFHNASPSMRARYLGCPHC